MISFVPEPGEVGERIDVVVTRRTGAARTAIQNAVRSGEVTVSGRRVRPSHRLGVADLVEGHVAAVSEDRPAEAEDIPIEVRYRDDRVLVVSKPAGLVTHPAGGHPAGTLVNALLALGEPLAGEGGGRPGIVHRLDKGTSGLVLVAKDDDALEFLQAALKRRDVSRGYLALVRGRPTSPSGTVDAPVGRHSAGERLGGRGKRTRRRAMAVTSSGRAAVTHFRVIEAGEGCALLALALETGRTHQIRVHLSHIGHPVLGDPDYGGTSELSRRLGIERPMLHAGGLSFPHPDDGRLVEVEDPPPEDLLAALGRAGIGPPGSWTVVHR